jgi:phosphate starvation-inducible PhoH-like protein
VRAGGCLRPSGDRELTDTSGDSRHRARGATPPGPLPDGPTQVKVVIGDDHSMVSLLGSGDELLRVIEGSFDADIHVRGNEITISGSPAETALVAELFEELTALVAGGAELTANAVERIVPMLRRKSGVRPAEVLTLDILSARGRTIRPKTVNQKRYVDAIDNHTIVFCIGPAGTGKTYLAMAKAVKALQAKEVTRIILTRPAVEAGERLGFLPGTLYEKIDPYLRPLYDALHDMLDPDSIPRLMAAGTIEVAPLAYMRGRTLNDSFIILDEAQNTSAEQMKMFLTRLGFGAKMVVTGDITQVDLAAGQASGLRLVQDVLEGVDDIYFARLVSDIVNAYEAYDARTRDAAGRPQRVTGNGRRDERGTGQPDRRAARGRRAE